ncbi:hypothetical protein [Paracraurococcus lichenis]|uniref:Phytanoyl-CoA dioxygenase n=1 Tax=Paracraurococcus lichenis TaxID=3064888 RepID=A0ABT9E1W8_9PROT|nr:hypothetical protein [Paracraurococcus sp. LOR1-02]MDO9710158.1 hypothetical protein [Paracraurococcus sp. LOR1-02]
MLPYARLTLGPGFRPLRAALYYAQRLAVAPSLRRGVGAGLAALVNLRTGRAGRRPALPPEAAMHLTALRQDGIVSLPPLLSGTALRETMDWLASRPVLGPQGPVPLAALPPGTASASYPLETVLRCPHVLEVANDPAILALAEAYLGCRPTLSSIGLRWSLPRPDRPTDVQFFHRDPDDWRFLKLFIYLTEVDSGSGPHVFVRGSHRTVGRLRAQPYHPEALARRYGTAAMSAVTGAAGTSFLADTWGIHAGAVPLARPRLMLQVQYSVLPVYALDYRPLPVRPARPLDRYVNRLLLAAAERGAVQAA